MISPLSQAGDYFQRIFFVGKSNEKNSLMDSVNYAY